MGARLIDRQKMQEIDKVTLSLAVKDSLYNKLLSHNQKLQRSLKERHTKHSLVYTGEAYESVKPEKKKNSTAVPTGLKTL